MALSVLGALAGSREVTMQKREKTVLLFGRKPSSSFAALGRNSRRAGRLQQRGQMAKIKVYGADWCSMTRRTLEHLKERGIEYQYIDIDKDREAAKWVADQNGGREKKPTLNIEGEVLSEPSNHELDRVLAAHKLA